MLVLEDMLKIHLQQLMYLYQMYDVMLKAVTKPLYVVQFL